MTDLISRPLGRRTILGGIGASALLAMPGCTSLGGFGFTEAIRRMLLLSSERAFARMTANGGFWDQQITQIGLANVLGTRGDILSNILTSGLFKSRLEGAFADIAIEGSYRAAPFVADAVRVIGLQGAAELVRGGPTAATAFLRGEMGGRLIEAMVPELADAMRVAQDPLVGQALSAVTGVDIGGVARRFSGRIDDAIWREMGVEEAEIRRNPRATGDPAIIGVFGVASNL